MKTLLQYHQMKPESEELRYLYNTFLRMKQPVLSSSERGWQPPVDVFETDDEYIVIADLARVREEDLKISFSAGSLTISGTREEMTSYDKRNYRIMEIDYGQFERKIKIPVRIDGDQIKANYKHGFLEIQMKKTERPNDQTIHVPIEQK